MWHIYDSHGRILAVASRQMRLEGLLLFPVRDLGGHAAHIRQSRPDSGCGFQANVLQTFLLFPLRDLGSHAAHIRQSRPWYKTVTAEAHGHIRQDIEDDYPESCITKYTTYIKKKKCCSLFVIDHLKAGHCKIVKRFRGGLVFKARRLFASLNSRLGSNEIVHYS